jgi:hypothetical protein
MYKYMFLTKKKLSTLVHAMYLADLYLLIMEILSISACVWLDPVAWTWSKDSFYTNLLRYIIFPRRFQIIIDIDIARGVPYHYIEWLLLMHGLFAF